MHVSLQMSVATFSFALITHVTRQVGAFSVVGNDHGVSFLTFRWPCYRSIHDSVISFFQPTLGTHVVIAPDGTTVRRATGFDLVVVQTEVAIVGGFQIDFH